MRLALVLLAACGATSPSPPPPASAPPVTSAPFDAPVAIVPSPGCADKEACHHEAEEHEAEGDFAAAAAAYGRACEFHDGASCFARGILLRGRVEPPDDKGSHDAFDKACVLQIADGCAQAATDLLTGIGTDEDHEEGRKVLEIACVRRSAMACHNLAVIHRDGTFGATKNPAEAYRWFEEGCSMGYGASCTEQAIALWDGTGTKKNAKRAEELADVACIASAANCWFQAQVLQRKKRHEEARALYDKSCGAGSAVGCHNLGVMLENGTGGAKDKERARAAYAKACSLGISDDCER